MPVWVVKQTPLIKETQLSACLERGLHIIYSKRVNQSHIEDDLIRKQNILLEGEMPLCSFSAELVLKVRIQNPNARENDFIEVELDRQELTYRSLLRVCCRELDISAEHVEKIRKLPNTMLRKVRERKTQTET